VAAASIIAKVARDRVMAALALEHPGYGWEINAGYPTASHRAALLDLGITPHHRRSFRPVHNILLSRLSQHPDSK
jgi:ribonuclease HII